MEDTKIKRDHSQSGIFKRMRAMHNLSGDIDQNYFHKLVNAS